MANLLEVSVKVTDLEPAKQVVQILEEAVTDERIPEAVRTEYADRIKAVRPKG